MSIWQFDPISLTIIVSLVIAFHVAWLVTSVRYNALVLPAISFLIASPLSLAPFFPGFTAFKLLRIYCTILMLVVGFVYLYKQQWIGRGSLAFTVFVLFFFSGVFWSSEPFYGLLYKGVFVLTALAGLFYGLRVASAADWVSFTRQMMVYGVIYLLIVAAGVVLGKGSGSRLNVWGMNANAIAGAGALSIAVLTYIGLNDSSKKLRLLAYVLFFLNLIMVLATGSRGGLAKAIFCVVVVIAPLLRNPRIVVGITLTLTVGMYVTLNYLLPEAAERTLSVEDSRSDVWALTWDRIEQNLLFGSGWAHTGDGSAAMPINAHSAPLQIISDIGVVGFTIAMLLFVVVFQSSVGAMLTFVRGGFAKGPLFLAIALFGAIMLHGLAEAGAVFGSTIDSFYWGLGIGLVDALRRIARQEQAESIGIEDVSWPQLGSYAATLR